MEEVSILFTSSISHFGKLAAPCFHAPLGLQRSPWRDHLVIGTIEVGRLVPRHTSPPQRVYRCTLGLVVPMAQPRQARGGAPSQNARAGFSTCRPPSGADPERRRPRRKKVEEVEGLWKR